MVALPVPFGTENVRVVVFATVTGQKPFSAAGTAPEMVIQFCMGAVSDVIPWAEPKTSVAVVPETVIDVMDGKDATVRVVLVGVA